MILDTCALLWLASGDDKLSRSAKVLIDAADGVYISAISGFEISMKVAKGKLVLPCPAQEWFEKVVQHHGLEVLALDLRTCVRAAQLPAFHLDPCDRFIIATAKLQNLQVVTTDEMFEQYGVSVIC